MKKRIVGVVFAILAVVSALCALTVTGSGFLDLSNLARAFFIGIAVVCAVVAWLLFCR